MLCAVVGRTPSRYIPVAVQRELRMDARDRCSLSGHLIPFREANTNIESSLLELHHVIFFSQGGESIEDNLMLVCPNCHAKVHRYPERYPVEQIREAKRLWERLRHIVPPRLCFVPLQRDPICVEHGCRGCNHCCDNPELLWHLVRRSRRYPRDWPRSCHVCYVPSERGPYRDRHDRRCRIGASAYRKRQQRTQTDQPRQSSRRAHPNRSPADQEAAVEEASKIGWKSAFVWSYAIT